MGLVVTQLKLQYHRLADIRKVELKQRQLAWLERCGISQISGGRVELPRLDLTRVGRELH